MRYETKTEKRPFKVIDKKTGEESVEIRDAEIKYVIFDIDCECGEKGSTMTFEQATHGRESDEALEKEIMSQYSHMCHDCCCKGRHDASHPNFNKVCKLNLHA